MTGPEDATTLCQAFQRTAAIDPDAVALRTPHGAQTLTWRDYAARVREVAAGLAALGVGHGDTVALMMANRIEFYPLEIGAQHLGATSFSVYNTLPAEDLAYVLDNAGAKVVICEAQYVDRVKASGAALDEIVCIDGAPDGAATVAELIAGGADDFDFESVWRAVAPGDVATLIYTSGTTGDPKGVEITHANLIFEVRAVAEVLGVEFADRITSFLPSAHIADRAMGLYLHEVFGTQITTVADHRNIASVLPDVGPTIWGAVPRVWEKLKAAVEFAVANEPDRDRRRLLQWGLAIAAKRGAALLVGDPVDAALADDWARADELVLSKLRTRLGFGQLRWAISGAAPIPDETLAFFDGLGIPIAEIWGMSELSCVATVSHPRNNRLGTVGRLLPGLEGKIADDGEYLVRGPLVMRGYRRQPARTVEVLDADGWLHTGDILDIDADGYLRVIDRKKELIINVAGKNMSPANIENTICAACPMIGVMITIGDNRPYNTALLVFDADSIGPYAARHGLAEPSAAALAADSTVIAHLADGVARGNAKLSQVEQIKRFRILPDVWEPGGDEITQTMKLRRRPILDKYAAEIDELYAPTPGAPVHRVAAAPTARPA